MVSDRTKRTVYATIFVGSIFGGWQAIGNIRKPLPLEADAVEISYGGFTEDRDNNGSRESYFRDTTGIEYRVRRDEKTKILTFTPIVK